MNHVDLFSGIGGFALAARWAGIETVQFVELDPFCQKVLAKNFPGVPIHDDIKTFKWTGTNPFILTGGFPCQPFSCAKHGVRGNHEDLSDLAAKSINDIRPRFSVIENVSKPAIDRVKTITDGFGIKSFRVRLSACQIGAWHKRNRWFLVTYPDNESEFQSKFYAEMGKLQGVGKDVWSWANYSRAIRIYDGVSNRVDRLKSLGNAIVPQVAYQIMRAIVAVENG